MGNQWVVLLQGAVYIAYADGSEVALPVGDSVLLPTYCRHRVSWIQPDDITV